MKEITQDKAIEWLRGFNPAIDTEAVWEAVNALDDYEAMTYWYDQEVRQRGLVEYAMSHDCPACPHFEGWKEACKKWDEAQAAIAPVRLTSTGENGGALFSVSGQREFLALDSKRWALTENWQDE